MLPDLPGLKKDVQEVLDDHLRDRAHKKLGVWGTVPRVYVHEGDRMRTIRADGSVDEQGFKHASAELMVKRSDVPTLTPEARLQMIEEMAEEMARKVSQTLYASLNATLEETGQTVSTGGKPLTLDVFFQTLEKMHLDFDENGEPTGLQMVIHPDMAPTLQRLEEQFRSDPDLQRRHREILDRKRMEWRAREASRKLVG